MMDMNFKMLIQVLRNELPQCSFFIQYFLFVSLLWLLVIYLLLISLFMYWEMCSNGEMARNRKYYEVLLLLVGWQFSSLAVYSFIQSRSISDPRFSQNLACYGCETGMLIFGKSHFSIAKPLVLDMMFYSWSSL